MEWSPGTYGHHQGDSLKSCSKQLIPWNGSREGTGRVLESHCSLRMGPRGYLLGTELGDEMKLVYKVPLEIGGKVGSSSIQCLSSYPWNSIYQKPAGQEPVAINPVGQTKVGQGRERLPRQQATPYTSRKSTGWAAPRVFCFLWNSKPKLKSCLCIPAKLGEMSVGLIQLGRNTSLPGVGSVTDISRLHVLHTLLF